jgi:Protein  of unknown function (DUF3018)
MRSSSIRAEDNAETKKKAAKERVRKHRESLRAQGLRPVQIWVPDTRRPQFLSRYRRQLEKISEHARTLADAGLLPVTEEDLAGWV